MSTLPQVVDIRAFQEQQWRLKKSAVRREQRQKKALDLWERALQAAVEMADPDDHKMPALYALTEADLQMFALAFLAFANSLPDVARDKLLHVYEVMHCEDAEV